MPWNYKPVERIPFDFEKEPEHVKHILTALNSKKREERFSRLKEALLHPDFAKHARQYAKENCPSALEGKNAPNSKKDAIGIAEHAEELWSAWALRERENRDARVAQKLKEPQFLKKIISLRG